MKKIGILNAQLSCIVASMGHTDKLVIGDSGLPVPRGKEIVDLALTTNIPRFLDVVEIVLKELQVEEALIAKETEQNSPSVYTGLKNLLGEAKITSLSHQEFKNLSERETNIAFVRTGEATPFANVMLVSGVTF
ncbi:MAG: D-ribose pyranase [candidate division Zixibacteria bacterium]|nr:D-ribose pyranase [candidate division Zixibacteria bacterium]NIV05867.1 D-ribose pyranase [candidate division Zixibacteria bacterium]